MRKGLSIAGLIARGLCYYWKINLTVMLAAAVGVAVLTGSLLVGASVRGSLRELALARLGWVGQALATETFFSEGLADKINKKIPPEGGTPQHGTPQHGTPERGTPKRENPEHGAAAVLMSGSAAHATRGTRAAKVQILGITDDFLPEQNSTGSTSSTLSTSPQDDEAFLNAALARELEAHVGDEILVRVPKPSAIPRETFIGERDDTVATLRLRVARILEANTIGDFSLGGSQAEPFNVFVARATLQRRLGQPGLANLLLAGGAEITEKKLKEFLTLEDAGLRFKPNPALGCVAVESTRIFMPAYLADLTTASAAELKCRTRPTLTYLANTLKHDDRSTPYSMIAALKDLDLRPGEIALNAWAAEDLGANVGDPIAIGYYLPAAGRLTETTRTLRLAKIVPLEGPWADRALTPDFPGLKEADQLSKWKPPFPLDMKRIRRKDEDYWNQYKATPKAFVSLATGRALWSNPYGNFTSIRVYGADEAALRAAMTRRLDPAAAGLALRPARAQALAASRGASDFGGLFIGFSLFLLVSAAMLIRILFILGVQGRSREYGLLSATGLKFTTLKRMMLAEGALIAAGGAVAGTVLGVAYAAVMLHGLRTWWVGAIGTPFLKLHVDAGSLAGGAVGGWVVALFAVWLAARRLAHEPARALLAGRSVEEGIGTSASHVPLAIALVGLIGGLGLATAGPRLDAQDQAGAFFGAGALLLISMLAFFRLWLRKRQVTSGGSGLLTVTRLGVLAARRRPGRSMLVAGLMASASFVIVAVGANRHEARPTNEKQSGTGGFTLMAESTLPLYKPLDSETLHGAEQYSLRLRPGDDASCLNLYQSIRPRIAGVPPDFTRRGGFVFASSVAKHGVEKENPWLLLERPLPDGAIPAIGDSNSVVWLLHSGLGKTIEMDGRRLRFVALLQGSIFQSELIVSAENFKKMYPDQSGWRMFLIGPAGDARALASALEAQYEDHGLDAIDTAERLNELLKVENTYLATFQALGGLGLLLGTAGLGLTLLRNLMERRAEMALLRAVGWRKQRLIWLAAVENLLLLGVGMAAGTICALVAVAPAMLGRLNEAPWASLALTIGGIVIFGAAATVAGAAAALHAPIVSTLKAE